MPKNIFSSQPKENRIFKNEKYLYPEFVPERLPHRDAEINSLVYAFNPIIKGGKPHNVFVFGPPGTGKTVCVKYVLDQLEEYSDRAKALYINCFEFNTRYAVLAKISNFVGAAVPRRGLATDEVYSMLLESMRKIDFTPIVILDEIDQLASRDEENRLLYDLLRVIEFQKTRFGIVIVSNDPGFTAKLDARVKSSLTEESITFLPYSPQQLKDILKERSEQAFMRNVLDEEAVGLAAAYAAKRGGDARVAIEALWKAGKLAEKENSDVVSVEYVKKISPTIMPVAVKQKIPNMTDTEKLIAEIIKKHRTVSSGELYKEYGKAVKKPLSERRIREVLSEMELKKIISAVSIDFGNRGKTRQFTLLIDFT